MPLTPAKHALKNGKRPRGSFTPDEFNSAYSAKDEEQEVRDWLIKATYNACERCSVKDSIECVRSSTSRCKACVDGKYKCTNQIAFRNARVKRYFEVTDEEIISFKEIYHNKTGEPPLGAHAKAKRGPSQHKRPLGGVDETPDNTHSQEEDSPRKKRKMTSGSQHEEAIKTQDTPPTVHTTKINSAPTGDQVPSLTIKVPPPPPPTPDVKVKVRSRVTVESLTKELAEYKKANLKLEADNKKLASRTLHIDDADIASNSPAVQTYIDKLRATHALELSVSNRPQNAMHLHPQQLGRRIAQFIKLFAVDHRIREDETHDETEILKTVTTSLKDVMESLMSDLAECSKNSADDFKLVLRSPKELALAMANDEANQHVEVPAGSTGKKSGATRKRKLNVPQPETAKKLLRNFLDAVVTVGQAAKRRRMDGNEWNSKVFLMASNLVTTSWKDLATYAGGNVERVLMVMRSPAEIEVEMKKKTQEGQRTRNTSSVRVAGPSATPRDVDNREDVESEADD